MLSIVNWSGNSWPRWRSTTLFFITLLGLVLMPVGQAKSANQEEDPVASSVIELTATFNDEAIPFNDQLITLGKPDAPLTSVLVYGLSASTTYLMMRWLPGIIDKYVTTGKMKLVVIDYPLTWHDMQALAGFRCVPANKHWEVLQSAVQYRQMAHNMKVDSYMNAPDHIWRVMKGYGVPREAADKCMRNYAIVGHIEAQRQIVTDTWNTSVAPTFVVGDKVLINPSSIAFIEEAIESALKGGK